MNTERFEEPGKVPMYIVTWSTGTSKHDERRAQKRVSPRMLATFIARAQAKGDVIYSVEKVAA